MKRLATIIIVLSVAGIAPLARADYGSGYENDGFAPTAFVEGTRDYAIKYFDTMRKIFAKHLNLSLLNNLSLINQFDVRLNALKKENAELLARAETLKARGEFLKEKDPDYDRYRTNLNELTALMFSLMKRIADETTLPQQ